MLVKRSLQLSVSLAIALVFFGLGSYRAELLNSRQVAESDVKIDALRAEMMGSLTAIRRAQVSAAGTTGSEADGRAAVGAGGRDLLIEEVKKQLQNEMGLMPVQLLRDRRQSFVELNSYDNLGKANYGTAGYLGDGYFITVKHGVTALGNEDSPRSDTRKIVSTKVLYQGRSLNARVIDAGDATVEVHRGDWAIIRVKERIDLPRLRVNAEFPYEFAEPIFRLGNDYSKGIILASGYVGQRTANGLVTCLTDGHPGVSGGGVLDQRGDLVGIPIGRMQGDYRFSFILPIRSEMFRKIRSVVQ